MSNFFSNAKVARVFAKGLTSIRKKEYHLSFVYEPKDRTWYIDMPWPGDRYNLAMVAGSDKLLAFLDTQGTNRVNVSVLPRSEKEEHEGYFECEQTTWSWLGGSSYKVHGLPGFTRDIWICPVTLCVLGHYPKYIYLKKE